MKNNCHIITPDGDVIQDEGCTHTEELIEMVKEITEEGHEGD